MHVKRLILIIGFIVAVLVLGFFIWWFIGRDVFTPTDDDTNANANQNVNGALPVVNTVDNVNRTPVSNTNRVPPIIPPDNTNISLPTNVATGGPTSSQPITDRDVHSAEPATSGNGIRYYDEGSGKFYELDEFLQRQEMSEKTFPEATDVEWSPTEDKAIITFPDDRKILYDFDEERQVTIPEEWEDIEFSPTGNKIGFKSLADRESEQWLAISNSDGSQLQLIEPIGDEAENVDVNWSPGGQVVALFRQSNNATAQEVYPVGLYDENFKSFETDGRGFEGTWSPDGTQMLYSVFTPETDYQPQLYLVDASGDSTGGNRIRLPLRTWSTRCTFATQTAVAYCAVPQDLDLGAGLVPEIAEDTNDIIYRIDTNRGTSVVAAIPELEGVGDNYSIASVFLSNDERTLYMSESSTGSVFSIQVR